MTLSLRLDKVESDLNVDAEIDLEIHAKMHAKNHAKIIPKKHSLYFFSLHIKWHALSSDGDVSSSPASSLNSHPHMQVMEVVTSIRTTFETHCRDLENPHRGSSPKATSEKDR